MASTLQKLRLNSPQTLLVCDWDGTIASTDTLGLIAPSPEALKPFTDAYLSDMQVLSEGMGPRDSLEKMFSWLDALEAVEFASVKRVEDGGLFKGMPKADMLQRARDISKLRLQDGILDLLRDFRGTWGIVSVGWSGDFIRAALESRGVDLSTKNIQIRANEVEFDKNELGTGRISKHQGNINGIRIARDKKREMQKMVDEWRKSVPEGTVVYVGDSETDLMCLLEADVGVIMNSPGMIEKCEKIGLQVEKAEEHRSKESRTSSEGHRLLALSDFKAFL